MVNAISVTAQLNAILEVLRVVAQSPIGVSLEVALGWIVLDALMTAALEKKLNRFAPEALSYFLEKIGGEYVGLLILGTAAYISPVMLVVFVPAVAAFTVTESNGAYQKIQAFIESMKKVNVSTTPQAPISPSN